MKVKLKFMVDPQFLINHTTIDNKVKVVIIDPEAIFLTGILGESGRKLVKAKAPFYFEKKLAEKLISKAIAKEIK